MRSNLLKFLLDDFHFAWYKTKNSLAISSKKYAYIQFHQRIFFFLLENHVVRIQNYANYSILLKQNKKVKCYDYYFTDNKTKKTLLFADNKNYWFTR